MSKFHGDLEASNQTLLALMAAEDHGLSVYASFDVDHAKQTFTVSLFNDEGGVIHQGAYKVVPA